MGNDEFSRHFNLPGDKSKSPYPIFQSEMETLGLPHAKKPGTRHNLFGLALSGGGIRSASFNLGLMQALHAEGLFDRIHYLSTVSGGGFIGGCLTTLLNSGILKDYDFSADQRFPFKSPALKPLAPASTTDAATRDNGVPVNDQAVRQLRFNSNYITPPGHLVDKYVRPAMVILRGMVLNFVAIAPYLLVLAMLLSFVFSVRSTFHLNHDLARFLLFDMQHLDRALKDVETAGQSRTPADLDGAPVILTSIRYEPTAASSPDYATIEKMAAEMRVTDELRPVWSGALVIFTGTMLSALILCLCQKVDFAKRFKHSRRLGLPLLIGFGLLLVNLYGMSLVYVKHWTLPAQLGFVSLLSLLMPKALRALSASADVRKKPWGKIVVAVVLIALVPCALLYVVGIGVHFLIFAKPDLLFFASYFDFASHFTAATTLDEMSKAHPLATRYVFLAVLALAGFIAGFFVIDTNRISLHHFYRDRLSRAFLFQAVGPDRNRAFTDVRHKDSLKLSALTPKAPYHLINVNLNLSRDTPFAHEKQDENPKPKDEGESANFRRAGSFVLSRNWCGSEKTGYLQTQCYERLDRHFDLGTAIAISGGAASVGMGLIRLPSLRLLMGLLNIRLGYWAPHPAKGANASSRCFAFPMNVFCKHIASLREWFSGYDLDARYVNLSDGGHFENLGVYELLRRRCKYIIVGDAEADANARFDGLSNLIRLARIDFGIEIDIDAGGIKPGDETRLSNAHCAVGVIHYPAIDDLEEEQGYLLYCKSSMCGDEPQDLRGYMDAHETFPHESTADQWFDEQQFEAYRKLGEHVGKAAFAPCAPLTRIGALDETFEILKWAWQPPMKADRAAFTAAVKKLACITRRIKHDMSSTAIAKRPSAKDRPPADMPKTGGGLDTNPEILRPEGDSGRQDPFASLVLQLDAMFRTFDWGRTRFCPENRGMLCLVDQWKKTPLFHEAMEKCANVINPDFRSFCTSPHACEIPIFQPHAIAEPAERPRFSLIDLLCALSEKLHGRMKRWWTHIRRGHVTRMDD